MWEVSGSGSGCQSGYRSGDLLSYDTPVWEVSGSGSSCQSGYRVMTPQEVSSSTGYYEALTPQCGRSVVHLLFVRVDIGVVPMKL